MVKRRKNNDLEKKNILDIYAHHMDTPYWSLQLDFEKNHYHNFINVSLHSFIKILYCGKKSNGKHLIRKHQNNKKNDEIFEKNKMWHSQYF